MQTEIEECRWCGNPRVYRLRLCDVCFEERKLADIEWRGVSNQGKCERELGADLRLPNRQRPATDICGRLPLE
jgi:hypothetical protein